MVHTLRKHLRVYQAILKLTIELLLEYRLNAFVHSLFAFIYFAGLWLIVQLIYSKTPALGGWSKPELLFLLGVTSTMWGAIEAVYFGALRKFMLFGITNGELDMILTKPVNPQFMVAFSAPQLAFFAHPIGVSVCAVYWSLGIAHQVSWHSFLMFVVTLILSQLTTYLMFASYATLAFFVTYSSQSLRMLQTMADHAQYPTHIYPLPIKIWLGVITPVALIGYIPTSFLLGKGSPELLGLLMILLVASFITNRALWAIGLRSYSSASS
jgi:ABC-2 type transport system permease protein